MAYDYTGQRWFGIRSRLTEYEMKKVGSIKRLYFITLSVT